MNTEDQAEAYHLMKIRINSYLKAYKEILIEYEKELKEYKEQECFHFMVELKKEHVDNVKGKLQILTDLNEAI